MDKILLVGGRADGARVEVDTSRLDYVSVPTYGNFDYFAMDEPTQIGEEKYNIVRLAGEHSTFKVGLHDSLNADDLMEKLITWYQRR